MKNSLILIIFCFTALSFSAQVKTFDNLERIYAQRHFKLLKRKATRALDNPDYDYSMLPTLYKSMAMFQLSQNERWFGRHPNALQEASDLFKKIKQSPEGIRVFNAHIYEISALKRDLFSWAEDLKLKQKNSTFKELVEILDKLFDQVPNIDSKDDQDPKKYLKDPSVVNTETVASKIEMVNVAKTLIGTPYVWAGEDPKGFDCSGYTGYMYKKRGITLPRRAADQYQKSIKVEQADVQVGDLVFFDNGSGISHVGIMVSSGNEPLVMIHASTSAGIIVTEIEKTDYWLKRLSGFGRYN